jgi:uncharacterized membrane protein
MTTLMSASRLEAFSDGVIAIIITIMVLELEVPHGSDLAALRPLLPVFLSYVLSFVYIAIYWNNHHHLLRATNRVNGRIMWSNMHLLFWLSLVPFVTGWLGQHHGGAWPTALYGCVMVMAAIAYIILQTAIVESLGHGSALAASLGGDFKGKLSLACYAAAIGLAFVNQWWSDALYALVALIWLIPDRRLERAFERGG